MSTDHTRSADAHGGSPLRVTTRRGERCDSRNEQRSGTGHRNRTKQLATIHIDEGLGQLGRLVEKPGLAQLFECKRKKSRIRRKVEARNDLGRDLIGCQSALFKELEHARSRRIEQMHPVNASVINKHLLVERVLEETGSYTRKWSHYATGKIGGPAESRTRLRATTIILTRDEQASKNSATDS